MLLMPAVLEKRMLMYARQPQEYTPEARPHPANSTAKKRQVVGAAPELVSEAGEPILCRFWEHTASALRRLPKPLLEARSRFLACCQGAM